MAEKDDDNTHNNVRVDNSQKFSKPNLFCAIGGGSDSDDVKVTDTELQRQIAALIDGLGPRDDVLLIPPDYTRLDSQAGKITRMICEHYQYIKTERSNDSSTDGTDANNNASTTTAAAKAIPHMEILPALGTHAPMTMSEISKMFGPQLAAKHQDQQLKQLKLQQQAHGGDDKETTDTPLFRVHDWRNDVVTIGEAPAEMVEHATDGKVKNQPWPVQLNRRVWEKQRRKCNTQLNDDVDNKQDGNTMNSNNTNSRPDPLILSIGQVVPHEVMGMANYNKNLFVGTGGVQAIGLSHFIGAVHGMERMMAYSGHANPLRNILNHASEKFLEDNLDLWYILTVIGPDDSTGESCIRGLFIGNDIECYSRACELSRRVNFTLVTKPIERCVVYLNPEKFHSTWLGNKAIYRTRMAMADGGNLIVLAPGVAKFGEDPQIDVLVRKYGYKGTAHSLKMMEENDDLRDELTTVAHLIHGSTEQRFQVTYCPGRYLSKEDIEQVGFAYADLSVTLEKYDPATLTLGWNSDHDGDFYFVKDPSLGLWAHESRFQES